MNHFNFLPVKVQAMFGQPALQYGESIEAYAALMKALWAEIAPSTTTECLIFKEKFDAHWERQRATRMKAAIPNALLIDAILLQFRRVGLKLDLETKKKVFRAISENGDSAELRALLQACGTDLQTMNARAFERSMKSQIPLDRFANNCVKQARTASDQLEHRRELQRAHERKLRDIERTPEYQSRLDELSKMYRTLVRPISDGRFVEPENLIAWALEYEKKRAYERELGLGGCMEFDQSALDLGDAGRVEELQEGGNNGQIVQNIADEPTHLAGGSTVQGEGRQVEQQQTAATASAELAA